MTNPAPAMTVTRALNLVDAAISEAPEQADYGIAFDTLRAFVLDVRSAITDAETSADDRCASAAVRMMTARNEGRTADEAYWKAAHDEYLAAWAELDRLRKRFATKS